MENFIAVIDKWLCRYFGINHSEIVPCSVQKKGNQLIILNTESFRRYIKKISLLDITPSYLKNMNKKNKEKLGIAVGKSIAKNLIVSFDEITIKKDNSDVAS